LKVDVDALPQGVVKAIRRNAVDLDDPAVTQALLQLNAVVGIILEKRPTGWTTTMGQLDVLARVAGATQGDFIQAAQNAKKNCPISTLLKATLCMNARLIG